METIIFAYLTISIKGYMHGKCGNDPGPGANRGHGFRMGGVVAISKAFLQGLSLRAEPCGEK